jgi:hypothetical protein
MTCFAELDRLEGGRPPEQAPKLPKPSRPKRAPAPPKVAKSLVPPKNLEEAKAPPRRPGHAAIEAMAQGEALVSP